MGLRMTDLHAPTVASGPSSHPTTNGSEQKLSLQELIARKDNIEAELSALGSVLDSHNVTMSTSLTTFDGYPRADIDVAQIRTTRARIIRLKTDHKLLMTQLEEAVHAQFAAGKTSELPTRTPAETSTTASTAAIEPPFARVNTIAPNSPAEQAGLRPGDKVTRFGTVDWRNHERLTKVAEVVQQNENRAIFVKVVREGEAQQLEFRLTPSKTWGGRGLLGCHLVPF